MNQEVSTQKRVFVVLGMARTGTSTISRALQVLGINLGNNLATDASFEGDEEDWRSKGFFEDGEIVHGINRRIFLKSQFAPYGIQTLASELQTKEKLGNIYDDAIDLLNERFEQSDLFGFKDPNTIKLLPFWRNVFNEMQVQENYIITLRNPLASARSYMNATGCELELGLLLWLKHLLQAIKGTHGKNRIIVSYDLMLQDPRKQLERIGKALEIECMNEKDISTYIDTYLDKDLDRFHSGVDELHTNPASSVAISCVDLYECLMKLARDEIQFDGAEFTARWQAIMSEHTKIYPMYCYLDHVLKKRQSLKHQLNNIHKSVLWKILSPLRYVDDFLRQRRRKVRLKKKAVVNHA